MSNDVVNCIKRENEKKLLVRIISLLLVRLPFAAGECLRMTVRFPFFLGEEMNDFERRDTLLEKVIDPF